MDFALVIVLCLLFVNDAKCSYQGDGSVQLVQNNQISIAQEYSSGIVEIYYYDKWGNVCHDSQFGINESDVICHQLGYTGASSYGTTMTITTFGTDESLPVIGNITCQSRDYLALMQCGWSSPHSHCNDQTDVVVICYADKLWDNPYNGQIRLTGGRLSSQGIMEVFCNSEWGLVCNKQFYFSHATVACKQLGYSGASNLNHLELVVDTSLPVWFGYMQNTCTNRSLSCFAHCKLCPLRNSSQICDYSNSVTIQCSFGKFVNTNTKTTCAYLDGGYFNTSSNLSGNDDFRNSIGLSIIIGCVVGIGVIVLIILIAVSIVWISTLLMRYAKRYKNRKIEQTKDSVDASMSTQTFS